MKTLLYKLILCLPLLALSLVARAAAPVTDEPAGITFFKGSWKEVLAEAKKQNKPVFVDIFTTWCGPCKLMARQAFPDSKVGDKFNAHFISYQIDAEKGEGIDVARKYAVNAYPTSLYVSASGDLIHRAIGYGGIKGMLDEADKAIEAANDPNPLSVMEKQYEGGKRDVDFLESYLQKRAKVGVPNGEAIDAYLAVIPKSEWITTENLELISSNVTSADNKAFDVLVNNVRPLRANPASQKLAAMLRRTIIQVSYSGLQNAKTEEELEKAILIAQRTADTLRTQLTTSIEREESANSYRMQFYQRTKNADKYRPLAQAEATKLMATPMDSVKAKNETAYKQFQMQTANMPDSVKNSDNYKKASEQMKAAETNQMAMKLNNLAWTYYQTMTDPKDLNQSLMWSAKSLEYNRTPGYLDTYAHLLSKLGRKEEAIKIQEEAIAKSKTAGEDSAELEKGLTEIKKK